MKNKTKIQKFSIGVLIFAVLLYPISLVIAQVVDPANAAANERMILLLTQEIKLSAEQIKKLKETIKTGQEALETAQKTKELFEDVNQSLEIVSNINQLKMADFNYITQETLELTIDPTGYIPNIPQTQNLRSEMRSEFRGSSDIARLHRILGNDYRWITEEYEKDKNDYKQFQVDRELNRQALAESNRHRKIQKAKSNYKLAEQLAVSADEMAKAVKTQNKFKMSEGERLALISESHNKMLQSRDLVSEADQLMVEASQETDFEKQMDVVMETRSFGSNMKRVSYDGLFVNSRK